MFIQLFICGVLIEEIEVNYYDCLNDEDKRKRNLCYAGHLKEKHFNKKVVFSKEWEIYLSAESKMNENENDLISRFEKKGAGYV